MEKIKLIKEPKMTPFFVSQKFFILLILLVEITLVATILILFSNIFSYVYAILSTLSNVLLIPILNSRMDSSYKVMWCIFIALVPVLGGVCYLVFANKKFTKKEIKKFEPKLQEIISYSEDPLTRSCFSKIDREKHPDAYNICHYIKNYAHAEVYTNTETTYFPWGEDAFPIMIEKLKSAKKFIFLEYFIIEKGKFWDSILEILIQKVKEGVDIKIIYDDFGCYKTLPSSYPSYLASLGIQCFKYAKLRPFVDARMNNRDHRKIMVIDGHTGFTGGINIADEYINEHIRFGKWKDNAIMLRGDGVYGLTTLFLSNWIAVTNGYDNNSFEKYLSPDNFENISYSKHAGLIQPYGSIPYTFETVGLNVYLNIISRAKKYLYISTPYLILDEGILNALKQSAKSGVDVHLLLPHIPDKKMVFMITRSYYKELILAGVKIHEYIPGFVHAKTFIADDIMGVVGTINLDYRSLFLHNENGVFLYHAECLKDIKEDFVETFKMSKLITIDEVNKFPLSRRFISAILRLFAPLM